MTGNEALVQGAWEAGVLFASAYPGTPSTEILENMSLREEVVSEWAPNEKVALEAAIGASIAGVRSMASMKHVGVNVAADALFTYVYTGVNGGLVPPWYLQKMTASKKNGIKSAKWSAWKWEKRMCVIRCRSTPLAIKFVRVRGPKSSRKV